MNASVQMLPEPLPDDPMPLAAAWLKEAWERRALPNPDAMVLATVDDQCRPSARVLLCKTIVAAPGYILFYTNYHSRKGHEIDARPRGAAVLHWDTLQRQLRIEGPIVKATAQRATLISRRGPGSANSARGQVSRVNPSDRAPNCCMRCAA